jgi:hypothetical protein
VVFSYVPTATQNPAPLQPTDDRYPFWWAPDPAVDGSGAAAALHVVPDKVSSRPCRLPAASLYEPTAMHEAGPVQVTAPRAAVAEGPVPAPVGSGTANEVHVPDEYTSINGMYGVVVGFGWGFSADPTATHDPGDGHEVALIDIEDVAPVAAPGGTGTAVGLHAGGGAVAAPATAPNDPADNNAMTATAGSRTRTRSPVAR